MTLPDWAGTNLSDQERSRLFSVSPLPRFIVGADECGYGAWAGPFTVCAVAAFMEWTHEGLADSKKLGPIRSAKKAQELLGAGGFQYAIRHTSSYIIDAVGPKVALQRTFQDALSAVLQHFAPDDEQPLIVLDGEVRLPDGSPRTVSLPKADGKVPVVMAASIIAKMSRDAVMENLGDLLPGYGFKKHKGYGTRAHEEAIRHLGLSDTHRKTYVPKRALTKGST